jgi:small subunit ribosomal protein S9
MANKLKKKTQVQKVVKKQRVEAADHGKKAVKVAHNFSIPSADFTTAVGRRKTATARVRLYKQAGDFVVNDKLVGEYFHGVLNAQSQYNLPFVTTDTLGKYAVTVKVSGSGVAAQLDAVVHGIARALDKMNPDMHTLLKKAGILTRDDRMRETRKIGTGGKARRAKQSPKR